jgi:mono/diheme cytochrome c family protein
MTNIKIRTHKNQNLSYEAYIDLHNKRFFIFYLILITYRMKTSLLTIAIVTLTLWGCGGASQRAEKPETSDSVLQQQEEVHGTEVKEIALTNPLSQLMVDEGQKIYDMKCSSCHKLTDERLVGPGWLGVTKRRKPTWIINMITNVDMMLEKDTEAQKLLEQCLVRMPNQNITEKEARSVLELMRKNDGEK